MKYELNGEKLECLECGDTIEYGRQDKKFCCETCKNRYNNRKARGNKAIKLKILSMLEKNYFILKELHKAGITSLPVMELKARGFNFDYFTSYQKVRRHDVFCCFDISFTVIADRVINITKMSPILPLSGYRKT